MEYDFRQQIHVITQPYIIKENSTAADLQGKILIRESALRNLDDQSVTSSELVEMQSTNPNSMIHIAGSYVQELVKYKGKFGAPNFFKLFRAFYKMCVIPKEAQNNPMCLYMDRASTIRGFKEVFNIDNEEIAIRFYKVLTISKEEIMMITLPKTEIANYNGKKMMESSSSGINLSSANNQYKRIYKIDLLRFYEVMGNWLDTVSSKAIF